MRVFQVCGDAGIVPDGARGSSVHLRSLAAALAKRGHEVTMFCSRSPKSRTAFPVPLYRLEGLSSLLAGAHSLGRPDFIYERYSLSRKQDLLSSSTDEERGPGMGGLGLRAARIIGCPFVLEVNAQLTKEAEDYRRVPPDAQHRAGEKILFRRADLVAAVSEPLLRRVQAVRGTSEGTVVIRNGCDPVLFPVAARPEGRSDPLAFLGDPRPWHGAEALPGLLRRLDEGGRSVRLRLIGGGKGAERVLQSARAQQMEDRVEITGQLPQDEAARRLAECSMGLAPYLPAPFFYFCPLKVIEYMAAGLPVVTTAQGDIPAILGSTGVLVPPGDSEAMTRAVKDMLDDPPMRAELGKAARARALAHLTWDHSASALEDAVRPML